MIELKNISAGYGKKNVIKDITLTIPKGKLITIIGPNGSGKSTLLKTAAGILTAACGDVMIEGIKSSDLSRQNIAKKIAYLSQGKSVPDMTVEQMVLHGRFPHLDYPRRYRKADREIANKALKQMGIADLSDRQLSTLSGGMRQNAYIAMALAQDTDYILFDEPTTYLDILHQLELMKTLRALADSGKGIVAVLHDLPQAFNFSDEIAVLWDGVIAAHDIPEKVHMSGMIETVFGIELQYCDVEKCYHYKYML